MPEIKPITPKEIMADMGSIIHPAVIQAVNDLLKKNYRGGSCTIKQDEIVAAAIAIDGSLTSTIIFKNHWMDFESVFVKAGWSIKYDKPGFNESYDAYFVFKSKTSKI